MGEVNISAKEKKELNEKRKNRLQNYKDWISGFKAFYTNNQKSNPRSFSDIHKHLPDIKKIVFIPHAAEILNHKYWDIVGNYLRLSLNSNGKVDEWKLINRYKSISASELTVMTIRPLIYDSTQNEKLNDEIERFINALFAWYIAIIQIHSWEEEDNKTTKGKPVQINRHIVKLSTYFEPALKTESLRLNFRNEHIRWLAWVETDSYIPVLSNAQVWRMFYFCLQALDNGMRDFEKAKAR